MMGGWTELEREMRDHILQTLRDILGDKYAEQFTVTIHVCSPLSATVRIAYRDALLRIVKEYDQGYLFNKPDMWTSKENKQLMYDFVRFVESEMTELLHELVDITYIFRKRLRTL